jgi:hypothetical protein
VQYEAVKLSPPAAAFCGKNSDGSSTCWLQYRASTATVEVSGGASNEADGTAVMQAMLTHLVELDA